MHLVAFTAVGHMVSLRVHVLALLVAPGVDCVTETERNANVRQLRRSAAEAIEEVALQHTSERALLERRHRFGQSGTQRGTHST